MSSVDLYWLPLGAGGWFVRLNGRLYERAVATIERRRPLELFHSALMLRLDGATYAIELCPEERTPRGRVAGGAVGARAAGILRVFRYEARCWQNGEIPDATYAVESPVSVSEDPAVARKIIELAPRIPTPVWGRDELGTGEMWNSNSVISWLLVRAGIDIAAVELPSGGRAPGWDAGIVVARRG